ncbi:MULTISPECIES: antitoxin [Lysinibacillus]|uniref:antitoxin n=1 Tax=Lysinibacillus TaxID=400634 RepID=UPI00214CDC1A|nr:MULTISPECIES: antitoxin [Lysinibacillus]UUV25951.1 antitoxin [Lysinibacillus sp. FN11]UYB48824.1 antitoxin [Lysinibacillus capsici]
MIEEIKQLSEDSRIQDKLREAWIKQMEIGYQEMAKINLDIVNEWYSVENEAESINEGIWKGE